jgi:hypothetical protein
MRDDTHRPTLGALAAASLSIVATLGIMLLPPNALAQTLFDAGQERLAVFPVYDGFTRNEDGSVTLSFAYFSHNSSPIQIAPGENNFFGPGAVDIGQPTTFLPGHHRWQCVVVVDEGFAGDLQWTLTHAGRTTTTSGEMLQYNWEFAASDKRQALRAIEAPTVVERNVCLNRPPVVRVLGYGGRRGPNELTVSVEAALKLFGSVRDEGLPRDGAVSSTWRKISGPGGVRFDRPQEPRTLAYFSKAGEYVVALTGEDSALDNTIEVTVIVNP